MNSCGVCGQELIRPSGRPNSRILLIGEFPGREELNHGVCFIGKTGMVLEYEMRKVGLPSHLVHMTNLWLHDPTWDKSHKKVVQSPCLQWMVQNMLDYMARYPYVLLMGSELGNAFGFPVSKWSGLQIKSPLLPPTCKVVMLMPNPAEAMASVVGEVRLGLSRFAQHIEE
jgi:hypothetical protein